MVLMENNYEYKQGGMDSITKTFELNDKCRVFELINSPASKGIIMFKTNTMKSFSIEQEAGEINVLPLDPFDSVTVKVVGEDTKYKWQAYGLPSNSHD